MSVCPCVCDHEPQNDYLYVLISELFLTFGCEVRRHTERERSEEITANDDKPVEHVSRWSRRSGAAVFSSKHDLTLIVLMKQISTIIPVFRLGVLREIVTVSISNVKVVLKLTCKGKTNLKIFSVTIPLQMVRFKKETFMCTFQ